MQIFTFQFPLSRFAFPALLFSGFRYNGSKEKPARGGMSMYDLGRQIRQRFEMWKDELKNHLYTPVGTVSFQFCTTQGHPTPQEAEKMP